MAEFIPSSFYFSSPSKSHSCLITLLPFSIRYQKNNLLLPCNLYTNITRGACQTQKVTFRWGFPSEDSEHGPDLYFLATPWEILVNQQVVEHSSVLIASDSLSSHPLTSPSAWLKMVSPAHHGPP
jgi:hypothetical protein